MLTGQVVFAQWMEFLPGREFNACVRRYGGDRRQRGFSCRDQFLCLAFGQLTFRESLRGNIPTFVHVSHGKMHDVTVLDQLPIQPGAFYVMDRGYVDFARLFRFPQNAAFFVTRVKRNLDFTRRGARPVDKTTGLRSDQTIVLAGPKSSGLYPDPLRRIAFYDAEHGRRLVFLTNNFALPALTVAGLYKSRWQVELFFQCIKQHLSRKPLFLRR